MRDTTTNPGVPEEWNVSHIAIVVADLDQAMADYSKALGGRWTSVRDVDFLMVSPQGDPYPIRGRVTWLTGHNPCIELLEGPPGSPWHVEPGVHKLDHFGYWGPDLDAQAAALAEAGYAIEYTIPQLEPDRLRGFIYLRRPDGFRIEVHPEAERPHLERWLSGADLEIGWMDENRTT
jgi:catechol 2,3-dioxygenase-like lactoylglutathione lyase family enzyme